MKTVYLHGLGSTLGHLSTASNLNGLCNERTICANYTALNLQGSENGFGHKLAEAVLNT